MNRSIFQEETQISNKHMKRCPIPSVIREMQIKTMKYHFPPPGMAVIKTTSVGEAVDELEPSRPAGGDGKGSHFGNQFGSSPKEGGAQTCLNSQ